MQTSAGDLKNIKYIIHASGPIWQNNFKEEDKNQFVDKIRSCIREALNLTKKMKDIISMSIPCISSGNYRGPKDLCSRVIIESCIQWLNQNHSNLERIRFCAMDQETNDAFQANFD